MDFVRRLFGRAPKGYQTQKNKNAKKAKPSETRKAAATKAAPSRKSNGWTSNNTPLFRSEGYNTRPLSEFNMFKPNNTPLFAQPGARSTNKNRFLKGPQKPTKPTKKNLNEVRKRAKANELQQRRLNLAGFTPYSNNHFKATSEPNWFSHKNNLSTFNLPETPAPAAKGKPEKKAELVAPLQPAQRKSRTASSVAAEEPLLNFSRKAHSNKVANIMKQFGPGGVAGAFGQSAYAPPLAPLRSRAALNGATQAVEPAILANIKTKVNAGKKKSKANTNFNSWLLGATGAPSKTRSSNFNNLSGIFGSAAVAPAGRVNSWVSPNLNVSPVASAQPSRIILKGLNKDVIKYVTKNRLPASPTPAQEREFFDDITETNLRNRGISVSNDGYPVLFIASLLNLVQGEDVLEFFESLQAYNSKEGTNAGGRGSLNMTLNSLKDKLALTLQSPEVLDKDVDTLINKINKSTDIKAVILRKYIMLIDSHKLITFKMYLDQREKSEQRNVANIVNLTNSVLNNVLLPMKRDLITLEMALGQLPKSNKNYKTLEDCEQILQQFFILLQQQLEGKVTPTEESLERLVYGDEDDAFAPGERGAGAGAGAAAAAPPPAPPLAGFVHKKPTAAGAGAGAGAATIASAQNLFKTKGRRNAYFKVIKQSFDSIQQDFVSGYPIPAEDIDNLVADIRKYKAEFGKVLNNAELSKEDKEVIRDQMGDFNGMLEFLTSKWVK